ncbi:MAG: alpha/beta fold hydrolase [Mycobacterium sp.]
METITVTTDDGWTAPLRVCTARPGIAVREPVVIVVPGIGVAAGYYELFARALANAGLDVVICELNGAAEGTPAEFGYPAIVMRYLQAHVSAARSRFGNRPVVFVGHSIGGQLATLYAACNPEHVRGLALVASGSNYQRCYSPVVRGVLLLAASMARNIKLPPGDIKSLWSALCEYPAAFHRDWAHVVRNGTFTFDGADYESTLAGLSTDVLAVDIRNDWLAPKSSIEHLLGKTPQARVTWWQEPGSGHNGWILDFAATVERLTRWLDTITAAPLDRASQS